MHATIAIRFQPAYSPVYNYNHICYMCQDNHGSCSWFICTASRLMIPPPISFPRARAWPGFKVWWLRGIWTLAALFFILFSPLRQCQTAVGRKASIGALTSLHCRVAPLFGVSWNLPPFAKCSGLVRRRSSWNLPCKWLRNKLQVALSQTAL